MQLDKMIIFEKFDLSKEHLYVLKNKVCVHACKILIAHYLISSL